MKNATQHQISVVVNGTTEVIEPCGTVVRIMPDGSLSELPELAEGELLAVSGMVCDAYGWRHPKMVSPGELLRDHAGRPIACVGVRPPRLPAAAACICTALAMDPTIAEHLVLGGYDEGCAVPLWAWIVARIPLLGTPHQVCAALGRGPGDVAATRCIRVEAPEDGWLWLLHRGLHVVDAVAGTSDSLVALELQYERHADVWATLAEERRPAVLAALALDVSHTSMSSPAARDERARLVALYLGPGTYFGLRVE
jgi:hypothetical protein